MPIQMTARFDPSEEGRRVRVSESEVSTGWDRGVAAAGAAARRSPPQAESPRTATASSTRRTGRK
jgi:hypothetical protein